MSYVVETMTNLAAQTGFAFLKPGNFYDTGCFSLLISGHRQRI